MYTTTQLRNNLSDFVPLLLRFLEITPDMKKAELVLVPGPGVGHLASTIEVAKILVNRQDQLSLTVFNISNIPKYSKLTQPLIQAALAASSRIRFIDIPIKEPEPEFILDPFKLCKYLIDNSKPHIKETLLNLLFSESSPDSPKLAGFVLDMFCVDLIDVANEFGVPSYVFYTSGAAFLGCMLHFQAVYDRQGVDPTELTDSDSDLDIPTLSNKFPVKVLPHVFRNKEWFREILSITRRFRQTKGIMMNTFQELESHAINSMANGEYPPVYPVGPILNLDGDKSRSDQSKEIIEWLDDQPAESVVFLCFGSMGSFGEEQVREIACALEHSGNRFLWSLRKPHPEIKFESPTDYQDLNEILPEGFLNRTAGFGKVIGWAPQVEILTHKAVGGFISHCGWNSTLESIWYGVPIATWPMYAEQQFNAFQLVIDLGLATEIKIDYVKDGDVTVDAKQIENGIRCLMEDEKKRIKMKEMSAISRKALMDGGSSSSALDRFIIDIMDNLA